MRNVFSFALLILPLIAPLAAAMAQAAAIEDVILSKSGVSSWCPFPREVPGRICSKQEVRVEVKSVVKNPKNEPVNFVYVVSGGEIVGSGSEVVWDLHKASPGRHSITVGIGDGGVIRGRTITKPLALDTCPVCDPPCECPSLAVTGPDRPVIAGDAFVVFANIQGGDYVQPAKMLWTAGSNATVVEGQGTLQALVRSDPKSKSGYLEVTFSISAVGLCPECPHTASVSVPIVAAKP